MNKYQVAVLHAFRELCSAAQFCDLAVKCCDGEVMVPGILLAALNPVLGRFEGEIMADLCLILPEVTCDNLRKFLAILLTPQNKNLQDAIVVKHVCNNLGLSVDWMNDIGCEPIVYNTCSIPAESLFSPTSEYSQQNLELQENVEEESESETFSQNDEILLKSSKNAFEEPEIDPVPVFETDERNNSVLSQQQSSGEISFHEVLDNSQQGHEEEDDSNNEEREEVFEISAAAVGDASEGCEDLYRIPDTEVKSWKDLENLCVLLDDKSPSANKKSLLSLAKLDIDQINDDVLSDNFSDQEGRLVCLVCYKIMEPHAYDLYRTHMKEHDTRQLDKVYIVMPDVGRGGPGLKKKVVTDQDLERTYLNVDGQLACKNCPKVFDVKNKTNFKRHLQYHTLKDKKYVYICNECNKEFNNSSNLNRHIKMMHEKQVFRCLHCDFEEKRKEKLENHLLTVHKDKGWIYDDVPLTKGFEGQELSDLTEPLQSLSDDSIIIFKCTGCNLRRRKRENIVAHIREQHSDGAEDGNSDQSTSVSIQRLAVRRRPRVPCDMCSAEVGSHAQLLQHKIRIHNLPISDIAGDNSTEPVGPEGEDIDGGGVSQPDTGSFIDQYLKCGICGAVCANKSGLRAHERTHKEKKYSCTNCQKHYSSPHQLKEHTQKGLCREENRKCKICDKVFHDMHRLQIHMRIHENIRDYKCDKCDKSFTQKRTLKEHMLTHSTIRQFQCKVCLKKFVQQNHLKYHMSSQHPSLAPEETRHKCNLCSKAFPFEYLLRKHQRRHGKAGVAHNSALQCNKCSIWFPSPILLKEHQQLKKCSATNNFQLPSTNHHLHQQYNDQELFHHSPHHIIQQHHGDHEHDLVTKIHIIEDPGGGDNHNAVLDMHNIVQHTADNTSHHVIHQNQSNTSAHGLVAGQDIVTFSTGNTGGSIIIDNSTVTEHGGIVSEEICMIVASANEAEGVGENMSIDVAMDRGNTSLDLE